MDLTTDHPFWLVKNGLVSTYPPLPSKQECDVVVVGGGITGAMVAQRLSRMGMKVIVVDKRDVCCGSTSASTCLLQYEIDVSLVEMTEKIGLANATRAYRLSHQSIDQIEDLVRSVGSDCGFKRKRSIHLAQTNSDAQKLEAEYEARRAIGLDVTLHNAEETRADFGLEGTAALSNDQSASCDGYLFAHHLLKDAIAHGAKIFDRTNIIAWNCGKGKVVLNTNRDCTLTAKHVVIATGYEAQELLSEKVVKLANTYAVVSQPLDSFDPWKEDWMMWQTKEPYLYLRTTADGRLLVGGEDDEHHNAKRRDKSLTRKATTIKKKVNQLIPDLDWEIEFRWAGTFGSTDDGLAYVGQHEEYPGCYFTLGFGGNGITFSSIAADLISAEVSGNPHPDADLFRFGR